MKNTCKSFQVQNIHKRSKKENAGGTCAGAVGVLAHAGGEFPTAPTAPLSKPYFQLISYLLVTSGIQCTLLEKSMPNHQGFVFISWFFVKTCLMCLFGQSIMSLNVIDTIPCVATSGTG